MEGNFTKNIKKEEKLLIEEEISLKLLLMIYIINSSDSISIKDSLTKTLKNFNEINILLHSNPSKAIKYFYFSKTIIHSILYEEEQIIKIEDDIIRNSLAFNFYLNLLINADKNITNYSYSFNYIENNKNDSDNKYTKIIKAKYILDLINNYEMLDDYDENNKEKLDEIKTYNGKYIEDNLNIFKELNLDLEKHDFLSKKIDEIYSKIIISLIKNEKYENYEFTYNIIRQIDLENIDITELIFDKLLELLNTNDIANYLILYEQDLYNEKKILLYYILLKFILKNSIYIYQVPALSKTRKLILEILKSNQLLYNNINKKIKDKLEYIIEKLADSKYYYQEIDESNIKKLENILLYYKQFLFDTKKDDINIIENIIKLKKGFYKKYLKDDGVSIKMNKRFSIIIFLLNKNINDNKSIKEEEIDKSSKTWDNYETWIKNKEINKINDKDLMILIEYIKDKNNIDILNNIFENKEYELLINFYDSININKKGNFIYSNNESSTTYSINKIKEDEKRSEIKYGLNSNDLKYFSEESSTNLNIKVNYDDINEKIETIFSQKFEYFISLNKRPENNNSQFISFGLMSGFNENIDKNNSAFNELSSLDEKMLEKVTYKPYKELFKNFIRLKHCIEDITLILNKIFNENSNITKLEIKLIFNIETNKESNCVYKKISCEYVNILENALRNYQDSDILNKDLYNKNNICENSYFYKFLNDIKNLYKFNNKSNISDILKNKESDFLSFQEIHSSIKVIGVHKKSANYVLELDNGFLISGGPEDIIFYENNNIKKKIKKIHNSIYPVINERKSIDILINSEEERMSYLTINKDGNIKNIFKEINYEIKSKFCFNFNLNKNYLICNNEGILVYNDILGKIVQISGNPIKKDEIFFGGILINDYTIALTSNKSSIKGEDELLFYNNNSKKIINTIKGHSYTKSQNNLALINEKILLCACRKYIDNQDNGILLVKIADNESLQKKFFDTNNFEVNCFCPIVIYNNNIFFDETKKAKYTNYFLVGGYDNDRKEGLIKIYKINYNDNLDNLDIEYIRDFKTDQKGNKNFEGFKKPISCMIQTKKTKNIIITCLDGKVYLIDNLSIN